ncbi:MAG: hypothetical protein ACJZ88_00080 [Paracoccus marcusii]
MPDASAGGAAGIRVQAVGGDVAAGYVAGVNGGKGAAFDAGAGLGLATEEGLRDQTETRSPSQLMKRLGGYLSDGLTLGISGGQSDVSAASGCIGQSMADQITPYFDGVTQGARNLGDVFDNLKVRFADMVSDMASRLFCSGLNRILDSVFGGGDALAGALSGAGLNAIPAFARGTPFSPEGLARLNERGGEILDLPGGTRVIPHDISKRMADRAGGSRDAPRVLVGVDLKNGNITAFVDERAGMAAEARVARFSKAELPGEVATLTQYEKERM